MIPWHGQGSCAVVSWSHSLGSRTLPNELHSHRYAFILNGHFADTKPVDGCRADRAITAHYDHLAGQACGRLGASGDSYGKNQVSVGHERVLITPTGVTYPPEIQLYR